MQINRNAFSSRLLGVGVLLVLMVLAVTGCGQVLQSPSLPVPTRVQAATFTPMARTSTPTLMIPTPTSTPFPASPTPSSTPTSAQSYLPLINGSLSDEVARLEINAPRQGSQGFVQLDTAALDDFSRLVKELLTGHPETAAQIATSYQYELYRYHDQGAQNVEFYVLRERTPFQYGWGLYIFQPEACRATAGTLIIEAPHVVSDEYTPQIALDLFQALHNCALLIAGAHRNANQDGSADVAHNPQSVFHVIHTTLIDAAGSPPITLQFHGFAAGKHQAYPPVVLGGSSENAQSLTVLMNDISRYLADHGISAGICDGVDWKDLCGETNVQALNQHVGMFIHLEMDEAIRSSPGAFITSLREVLLKK